MGQFHLHDRGDGGEEGCTAKCSGKLESAVGVDHIGICGRQSAGAWKTGCICSRSVPEDLRNLGTANKCRPNLTPRSFCIPPKAFRLDCATCCDRIAACFCFGEICLCGRAEVIKSSQLLKRRPRSDRHLVARMALHTRKARSSLLLSCLRWIVPPASVSSLSLPLDFGGLVPTSFSTCDNPQ